MSRGERDINRSIASRESLAPQVFASTSMVGYRTVNARSFSKSVPHSTISLRGQQT